MESRVEEAVERFRNGCNCAQSVFVTYADHFGLDREVALKLAAPFGGGLAGMRQVCGTVSAMSMLAGLYNGGDKDTRKANYDTVKRMAEKFRTEHGSIRCGQLLGLEPGLPEGFMKKPCTEYVRTCAMLVEEHLLNE